jgi:tetratricopeptide (TPR) repeat protein
LPAGVRDVVLQRVGRLSEPAQRLLTLAAVVGRGFDTTLLQAAAGPDADAVDESLDEWFTRRLVQLPPTSNLQPPISNLQYDFSHDKIRAAVYHAAGPARQRLLHQRVGVALENLYADRLRDAYEQLAHHYEQAGLVEQALTYLPLAAAKATAVYAHQEALAYLDRALALLGEGDARCWETQLQRGRVLHFLSRYDEALIACRLVVEAGDAGYQLLAARAANELSTICRVRRDYGEARAWGERAYRLAEEAGEMREQARARQVLGEVEREQGNLETAQEQFEEALARYRALRCPEPAEGADRRGVAECLNGLGHVFSSWARYDEARERFEEALAVFRDLGDRQSEATCLRAIGMAHWRQITNEAAHQAFAESLAICRAIGDREGEAQCLNDLGLVYLVLTEHDEVRRCWQESATLFQALGLEKRAASCLHRLGILHQSDGNYAASRQCLEESLAVNRAAGAKANEALDLGWLGRLYLMRGEYDEARRCLERALALGREIGGSEEETWHLTWLGAVAYETGNLTEARDHLQKAIQLGGERGVDTKADTAWRWLALVHLARGNGPAALTAARQALAKSEEKPSSRTQWWTELSHAMLGTVYASGLLAEAEDPGPYFERVLTSKTKKNPYHYGAILRRYGAYLLRSGDHEQGEVYLRQALSILERIGAQGELDKVRRLLAGDDAYHLRW